MAVRRYAQQGMGAFSARQDSSDAVTAAEFASMRERQNNFSNDLHTLNDNITTIRADFTSQFVKLDSAISMLASKIAEGSKTPWGVLLTGLSFLLAFAGSVGWLAYAPVRENLTDLKTQSSIQQAATIMLSDRINDRFYSKDTMNLIFQGRDNQRVGDTKNMTDRLDRLSDAYRDLRSTLVPRQEHDRQWTAQAAEDADLRRSIDEVKTAMANIYNPRDVISRMERKQDEDEALILQLLKANPKP